MRISELIQETSFVKYPEPRLHDPSRPLGRSEVLGPDGRVYHYMDPRATGKEEKPYKFKPSEFKPGDKPSGSGKLYPDPLEPVFKDGKPVGVVMPDGKTRPWSKSDALGPDGKVYNWMDPRGRKIGRASCRERVYSKV